MGASEESKVAIPHPALYVGDLDPTVDESELAAAFARFGLGPASVRVLRDRITGSSLRYAYLNFPSFTLAAKAMDAMKYTMLKGRPMRIMWSVRNPQGRRNGSGNLFVKNIEEWITAPKLEKLFKDYGHVMSCKVALDENGNSKGFGFVQMGSAEEAKSAVVALHGKILNGGTKQLYVANFIRKMDRQGLLPQGRNCTNLYIKNLEPNFTDDLLRAKFSEFGKVCSAAVMKDDLGKSRGFGFVTFELLEHAKKAIEALNGSVLGSKTIYVGIAQKKAEREEQLKQHFSEKPGEYHPKKVHGSNVYVKYLSDSVDDKSLREFFSLCGKVVSAKVMQHPNGASKGFGFVSFSSPEAARKAVAALHGAFFQGKLLYVAIAQRREERLKKLRDHFVNMSSAGGVARPPTSYSYNVVYPLLQYEQPKNYMHIPYQGYRCFLRPPVPFYQQQNWSSYPQYASFDSSQLLQHSFDSSQLLQHSVGTPGNMWPLQQQQPNKEFTYQSQPFCTKKVRISLPLRTRKVKISCPEKPKKQKADGLDGDAKFMENFIAKATGKAPLDG